MILSQQSITDIIVCITLGVLGTIILFVCIRYDLYTKLVRACTTSAKVVPGKQSQTVVVESVPLQISTSIQKVY